MIIDVTDLLVYRNALNLTRPVYRLVNLIPKSHYKLRVQIIGPVESIAPAETFKGIKPETCDALIEKYKILSKQLQNLIKNGKHFNQFSVFCHLSSGRMKI